MTHISTQPILELFDKKYIPNVFLSIVFDTPVDKKQKTGGMFS
jgi:hypothetical protein